MNKPKKTDTLKPDLVTFYENTFLIFDAKYYNLDFTDDNLVGQPGLESITKQYLYELAYREFYKQNKFDKVINAFLFPSYSDELDDVGVVELKILHDLGLGNIYVVMVPACKLNQMYLDRIKYFIDIISDKDIYELSGSHGSKSCRCQAAVSQGKG